MRLTEEEKKICRQYSTQDEQGNVHCYECPLVIDRWQCVCKANCFPFEWEERKENDCKNSDK